MVIQPSKKLSDRRKQSLSPGTHLDIRFLKNVTGAFVAPGLLNPRESIAFFAFWHDGLLEPCALGLKMP